MVTAFTLKFHAEKIREEFGEKVYDIMRNYFYVNNGTGGSDDPEEYRELKRKLRDAMLQGGFSLSKWKFSHPELIGNEDHTQETEEKILGIQWNMETDRLSVVIEKEKFEETAETPRKVVKLQASIYDPLGILAPFILLGRLIIQAAMQGKWGWDTKMSEELVKRFARWLKSIWQLRDISIPRPWNDDDTVGL